MPFENLGLIYLSTRYLESKADTGLKLGQLMMCSIVELIKLIFSFELFPFENWTL